jgi:FKBP-type peptidyl-prolyl cis-trans isomerase FkpA
VRRTLLAVLALTAFGAAACGYADPYTSTGPVANESPGPTATPSPTPGVDDFNAGAGLTPVTYPDGLQYIDLTVGTGASPVAGENVTMYYTGWLSTGVKFDSSRDRGAPFTFQIGMRPPNVILGWEEGIPGMKIGGKRKLIIPPSLGYGPNAQKDANGNVVIPAGATLVFEVELLSLAPGPTPSPSPPPSPSPSPSPSPTPSPSHSP